MPAPRGYRTEMHRTELERVNGADKGIFASAHNDILGSIFTAMTRLHTTTPVTQRHAEWDPISLHKVVA